MIRLKYTQIAEYRSNQLQQQQNLCALCGEYILDDAVLDHDHDTGEIRSVLHRGCNALLGKIENNMVRNRVNIQRLAKIADNLIGYLTADGTDLLHPTHKEKTMNGRGKGRGKGRKPPKR